MASAEGMTHFTGARHNVGWAVYEMFASLIGLSSEFISQRVAVLDKARIASRIRKKSVAYKKRNAALDRKHLVDNDKRVKMSALKGYSYKAGGADGTKA